MTLAPGAGAAPAAVEMRGVTKRFPGVTALDGIDLRLEAGEVHALAGENGAGKSSLIKVLCGAYPRDGGEIFLAGRPFWPRSPFDAVRAGIRVVHQELQMLDHLSVAENLLFEALPCGPLGWIDRRRLAARAAELLATVGLDDVSPSQPVAGLGMAQRQLIEVAKALSAASRVVVMDEPTATLTSREVGRLFAIVRRLRAEGVAVVYITHHLQELFEIADRVTVLRNGRKVATQPIGDTTPGALVRLMVGRDIGTAAPARLAASAGAPPGPEALRVEGLRWRGQPEGASVGFAVRAGEVLGIGGLVGSGRTETLRAVFGADRARAGRILRQGRPVTIRQPADALREGICLVTEDRKDEGLVLDMPVRANITLATLRRFAHAGWLDGAAETDAARAAVERLDIRLADVEQPPRQLSGGNQQKVVLAKWLLCEPVVLLLDEPTRGVDVGAKSEIHALLHEMAGQGMAIVVVSSDLPELMHLADRIVVLSRGHLAGELPRAAFDERVLLQMAYSEYMKTGAPHAADALAA